MAKGKKFPDLNKDGKITMADILKGRGVYKKGGRLRRGKVNEVKSVDDFDYNLPTPEARSRNMNIARDKMRMQLIAQLGNGYSGPTREGMEIPEIKMFLDEKTGEYIARPVLSSPAYKKGGKTKSRVNEAGNYTKPAMRKRLFNAIKAGSKGGKPGQWSARKAQLLANRYKKAGGGYRN